MTMDIMELLRRQDEQVSHAASEVNAAEILAAEAHQDLIQKRMHFEKLREQRETLTDVARQNGVLDETTKESPDVFDLTGEATNEWRSLTRLDAVERVLRETTAPRHITEIETDLKFHGRTDDTYPLVSASLANLRARRGTVVAVGHGRWEFNRAGTNTVVTNQIAMSEEKSLYDAELNAAGGA